LVFRAPQATLTSEQVEPLVARVVTVAVAEQKLSAKLRV
jgi:phenylalanyl-tRNA synthetase beta subunit